MLVVWVAWVTWVAWVAWVVWVAWVAANVGRNVHGEMVSDGRSAVWTTVPCADETYLRAPVCVSLDSCLREAGWSL